MGHPPMSTLLPSRGILDRGIRQLAPSPWAGKAAWILTVMNKGWIFGLIRGEVCICRCSGMQSRSLQRLARHNVRWVMSEGQTEDHMLIHGVSHGKSIQPGSSPYMGAYM